MFAALKWHDALISGRVDGRTKQSILEVAAALHSLACVESYIELTEAMSVKLLAKDKLLLLDRRCNQRDRRAIMHTACTKNIFESHLHCSSASRTSRARPHRSPWAGPSDSSRRTGR